MKKITLFFLFVLATTFGYAQNLITNGTFDDATGWTPLTIHGPALNIGDVTIANGVATFTEVDDPEWTHLGIGTSVYLEPGIYQFDMDVSFNNPVESWGEVWMGTTEPVQNLDFNGDVGAEQIMVVHHTWNCGILSYSGLATASGCGGTDPGKFTITTAATYYIVYKTGGNTIGDPIVIDNVTLVTANPSPEASFTTATSTSNLDAVFTNTSMHATDYTWDFGDGSGSTQESPTHTYAAAGPYTVTLLAESSEGTSQYTAVVIVGNPTNYITNGTFDDATGWTIVNHYEAANTLGDVTISGGTATWTETEAGPWKHMGIYTSIYLDPGTYQFDMNMTYADINDIWGEVYLGATEPVQNADYGGDFQVLKAFNAWDCSGIKTYSGSAAASGCDGNGTPGQFDITTAGTYYLLFRTGGATYGPTGIVIDDMTLYEKVTLSDVDFTIEGVGVYPNPATDKVYFKNINGTKNIRIFDVNGRVIKEQVLESNELSIESLSNGLYFLEINGQVKKLLKK
mgnify:FL=1